MAETPPSKIESNRPCHVFGPVPSRRLGHSLGIDLVPFKTCTYDCIYCQLGRTIHQTIERKAYVPSKHVIDQLKKKLDSLPHPPDYITFSGSGEPTLHSEIGKIIQSISQVTTVPIAVLTNGSLLHLEPVRKALAKADLVIPSLDAPTPYLYKFVNRPHGSLHFAQLLSGLKDFRREYAGQIWLEVMLCRGINDDMQEIQRLREEVEKIGLDRIQLNTVVRPPAEDFAFPLDLDRLDQIARCFSPRADVLPGKCPAAAGKIMGKPDKEILALLERRPCSLEDLSQAFGISSEKLQDVLAELQKTDAVQSGAYNHTVFYRVPKKESHQLGPLR